MSSKRSQTRNSRPGASGRQGRILAEVIGVVAVAFAAFAILALFSYAPSDPIFEWVAVANRAGVVGATLAGVLNRAAGAAAFFLVGVIGVLGVRLLLHRGLPAWNSRFSFGFALMMLAVLALPSFLGSVAPHRFGSIKVGVVGGGLAHFERGMFGSWGGLLLNALLLAFGCLSLFDIPTGTALAAMGRAARRATKLSMRAGQFALGYGATCLRGMVGAIRSIVPAVYVLVEQRARRRRVLALRKAESGSADSTDEASTRKRSAKGLLKRVGKENATASESAARVEPTIVDHAAAQRARRKPEQESFAFDERTHLGPFQLPDTTLFELGPSGTGSRYDRDSLLMNSKILEKKLQDFNVRGHVVAVHPGPVITMYEFEPAAGVKVGSIVRLSNDLSLALRALSIRIVAPIPGKAVVGIEIPNKERDIVYLRELLESDEFRASTARIPIALGKDIFGTPILGDLTKMPHLLVAGATGTGKSVFLNALIASVLMRARPDEVKLLMIDPKMLELSVYQGIPHLIADVVTDPKRASAALHGVVRKMEERYQMMAALGVRDIDQFNRRVDRALESGEHSFRLKDDSGNAQGDEVQYVRIPYIIVIIDELADLMIVSAKNVEDSLQRLAQMARASGIHLVLATQRPSVDVLTGVIKANFPSRISFQVSSRTDSRTILDANGAEDLLGDGDMLYLPPGTAKILRLHGPLLTEREVARLATFLKEQARPEFDDTLIRAQEEGLEDTSEGDEEVDEMFDRAVAIVADTRNASISYLQRRLKVGYNRAARMIEQMEKQGMIGPQIGSRTREVYLPEVDEYATDD